MRALKTSSNAIEFRQNLIKESEALFQQPIPFAWGRSPEPWTETAATYFRTPLPFWGCDTVSVASATFSLRKEVIQPQVLLRLPCYDFTPIMNHTLGRHLPCGLMNRLLVQSTFVM